MTNEIIITVEGLLWFCGAIAVIGGAVAIIAKCFAPFQKLKAEVNSKASEEEITALKKEITALNKEVEGLKNYQSIDHEELKKVEVGIEKICKCTLAITEHELTGNGDEKLQKAKDEMEDYLIKK